MGWFTRRRLRGDIQFGVCSDIGRVRTENQDTYGHISRSGASGEEHLFIVADGMGGYERGGEASRQAVDIIQKSFCEGFSNSVQTRLTHGFELANDFVYNAAMDGTTKDRMGTTCTALAIAGDQALIVHIGDTRAYRVRNGRVEKLTVDHTLVEQLREEGVLTEEEARHHPNRNALTRAIGIEETAKADVIDAGRVHADDAFVLCTDGLSAVTEAEIRTIVRAMPPQAASDKLAAMANERGGSDNITVLIVTLK